MNNEDLKKKIRSKPYTWGRFVQFHEVGGYLIVEYKAIVFNGVAPKVPKVHKKESSFHPYNYGSDTNTSFNSLEGALVGAIARHFDGRNTKADIYFMRAIEAK